MVQQQETVQKDAWVQSEALLGAARFVTQGVDANDVRHILARVNRNAEWLREWSATAAMHEELARQAAKRGYTVSAGEAYIRAALCYHFGKMRWIEVLKKEADYHQAHTRSIDTFRQGLHYLDPTAERVDIPYEAITIPAYLRKPPGVARPPVVILVPGFDSVKEEFYHWGNVFLKRGLAILSPDGPGQGETRNYMPIRYDYETAGTAMIDYLQRRDDVDATAIGVVGVSLGGYYAPRIAAFDQRVKAVISNGGSFKNRMPPERLGPWAMFTNWTTTPEATAAKMNKMSLEGVIGNIRCPYLVVNGKQDAQSAYTNTEEMAREADKAGVKVTYVLYEEGAHVCFNIPYKYQPLNGDWMAEQLRRK